MTRGANRRGQPQQILARLRWRGLILVKRRSLCYDRWWQQRWVHIWRPK